MYLARYCHQSFDAVRALPLDELPLIMEVVGELVEQENKSR